MSDTPLVSCAACGREITKLSCGEPRLDGAGVLHAADCPVFDEPGTVATAEALFMWANEDALPEIDGRVYDFLWPMSRLVDGCRMFPWPTHRRDELGYQPNTTP